MLHLTDINAANFKERVIMLTMYQFMTKITVSSSLL